MGREDNLIAAQSDLLQQLPRVPMRKDAIGGEIVRRIHEMRLRGRRFAGPADAAF